MKHFQEYVHLFDAGAGRRMIRVAGVFSLFLFVALAYHVRVFRGLDSMEAMNSAQLARNLAEGRGYVTSYVTPMEIAQLNAFYLTPEGASHSTNGQVDLLNVPELGEPPAYPLLLGMWLKATQADFEESMGDIAKDQSFFPDQLVVVFNYLCLLMTGIVLYLMASRMFDRRVGLLAVAGLALGEAGWQSAGSGQGLPLLMLLVTAMFAAVHEALLASEEDRPVSVWIWLLISGVVFAGALWVRMVMLWLLPVYVLVLVAAFRTRILPAALAVLLVLASVVPWGVRNYQISGDPFGTSLRYVALIPPADESRPTLGASAKERSMVDTGWDGAAGIGYQKLLMGARYTSTHIFGLLGTSVIIVLFVAGLLHAFRRPRVQILRLFLVGAMPLLFVGGALFEPRPDVGSAMNLLLTLWPIMAAFGIAFFYVMLDRLNPPFLLLRYLIIGAFMVVCAAPLLIRLGPPGARPYQYPPYFPPMLRITGELFEPNEILVSDLPWATAWYADRVSLLLPSQLSEFYELNDSVARVSGMLLTPQSWNQPLMEIQKGQFTDWNRIVKREGVPNDFPLNKFLPMHPRKNDYYLFSDKKRW